MCIRDRLSNYEKNPRFSASIQSNQSSLISVDKDCSVLSLNFTSESFYHSHSTEQWLEKLKNTSNQEEEVQKVVPYSWLNQFQVEIKENNKYQVKRALRLPSLQIIKNFKDNSLFYR